MLQSIPESVTSSFGLFGVAVYLGSYAMLQLGLVRGSSYTYAILNIIAAGSVAVSLIHAFNLSSLLIQTFWIVISLVGIARVFFLTHSVRFTPEERKFIDSKFPKLAPHLARRYLNIGTWVDVPAGTDLTVYDRPVEKLCYISEGSADVIIAGEVVGRSSDDTVIGELTALTEETASATVRTNTDSRIFIVETAKLKRFLASNDEIDFALRSTFVAAAREKLLDRNEEVKRLSEENEKLKAQNSVAAG